MPLIPIWERYIWRQILQVFFGTLICFYALYVLVDFSNQLGAFRSKDIAITWLQWMTYYAFEFIHRANVLIPFALLLTTMRVLLNLNGHNELVALQCGGISQKRLLRPILHLGFACMLFLYANEQWLIPKSLAQVKFLHAARKQKPLKTLEIIPHSLPLSDGSYLVYQNYEPDLQRFFDSYWIKSMNEIYKIKYFYPYAEPPYGEYVDILKRDDQGKLALTDSQTRIHLKDLSLGEDNLQKAATVPELQPLSKLWQSMPSLGTSLSPREAQIATTFYHKATLPWLCILAVLLPASFCLHFTRNLPTFLYYAVGIFSFIAFYLFIDSLTVVSRRQLFDPAVLMISPIFAALLISFWRYSRLK